jgi:hypothetical protein
MSADARFLRYGLRRIHVSSLHYYVATGVGENVAPGTGVVPGGGVYVSLVAPGAVGWVTFVVLFVCDVAPHGLQMKSATNAAMTMIATIATAVEPPDPGAGFGSRVYVSGIHSSEAKFFDRFADNLPAGEAV